MPTPWTKDEEKQMIKQLKENKTFDQIAKIHNRSISAMLMRYNKIIYDNVKAGKSKTSLAKLLNTSTEKITQAYYEHKSFLEKKEITSNKSIEKPTVSSIKDSVKENIKGQKKIIESDKLKVLERENQILKKLIENIRMKQKLGEAIGKKELMNKVLDLIKKY